MNSTPSEGHSTCPFYTKSTSLESKAFNERTLRKRNIMYNLTEVFETQTAMTRAKVLQNIIPELVLKTFGNIERSSEFCI